MRDALPYLLPNSVTQRIILGLALISGMVFVFASLGLLIAAVMLFVFQADQTVRTYCVKAEDIIFADARLDDNCQSARLSYTYKGTSYTPDGRLYLSSNETLDSIKNNIYVLPKDPSSIYVVTSISKWGLGTGMFNGVGLYSLVSFALFPSRLYFLVSHVVSYPLAVVYVQLRLSSFRNRYILDDFQRDHDDKEESSEEGTTETTMTELSSSSLATTDGTII
jgi:hypothetical protein